MQEKRILTTLRDLSKFAKAFFNIRNKGGKPSPFILNTAQRFIHHRLETQLKETGKVRAVILKGRQQGVSTYIQARYFHKIITSKGKKAFILTHEAEATKNLFEMTKRYYDHLPEGLCPHADSSSAKELKFLSFDSGYAVGTAGNKGVGRSQTIQLFHGCLATGTKVYDPENGGIRNIEDFSIGDLVLTRTGKISPITFISKQQKECLEVIFRGLTAFPLIATPDHRFWTKHGWKRLEDFKSDDVIGYPIKDLYASIDKFMLPAPIKRGHGGGRQFICPDSIKVDYRLGRLIGLYLAEGHIKLQNKEPHMPSSITFAVHRKELGRTIKWVAPFHKYFSSIKTEDREDCLTSTVTIYGNRFAMLIDSLCGRTTGKHLPLMWNELGSNFCKGMLHGYIAGDGHSDAKCRRIRASSICPAITITLRDLAASLGYGWASIEFKEAGIRHGRDEKDRYTFSLCGNGANLLAEEIGKITPKIVRKKTKSNTKYAAVCTEISDGYAWLRFSSILHAGIKEVYDFEVEDEDHSYCILQGSAKNSEVGFWDNTDEHATGILQAISGEPGTEIILESTANGIGNYFHKMWQAAISGESEFQAIFVPWFWQDEYVENKPGFKLNEEEQQLYDLYKSDGLTIPHLQWRRIKINESGDYESGLEHFKQEYPFTSEEAFRNPIDNVFINAKHVVRARKARIETESALIIGVDPAISDNDRTAIIRRRGRRAYKLQTFRNHNTMEIAGKLSLIIKDEKPHKVYIDCIGIGAGIVDRLRELGYNCVEGINVGRSANNKDKFKNLRAELWWEMREWLMQEMAVQIPDSDELHGDLCSLGFKYTSSEQLQIEGKDQLKARGMPSCDTADALMLTFFSGFYESSQNLPPRLIPKHHHSMFT